MFRVPTDPGSPTFDDTFKVGFFRWLTSNRWERNEWMRRRWAAAETARNNQDMRAYDYLRERAENKIREQVAEGKRTEEDAAAFLAQLDAHATETKRRLS